MHYERPPVSQNLRVHTFLKEVGTVEIYDLRARRTRYDPRDTRTSLDRPLGFLTGHFQLEYRLCQKLNRNTAVPYQEARTFIVPLYDGTAMHVTIIPMYKRASALAESRRRRRLTKNLRRVKQGRPNSGNGASRATLLRSGFPLDGSRTKGHLRANKWIVRSKRLAVPALPSMG